MSAQARIAWADVRSARRAPTGKNWDFEFLKAVAGMLSGNFPEKLAGAYLYPASSILAGLWKLVQPFFEPRTRSKVRIITSTAELLSLIPAEYVPVAAGGTSEHIFDPAIFDNLLPAAQAALPVEVS